MSLFIIKPNFRFCREGYYSKGQALLETLLLALLSVFFVASLISQFHTTFDSYMESYFKDYIACLLEVGELAVASPECRKVLEETSLRIRESEEQRREAQRKKAQKKAQEQKNSSSSLSFSSLQQSQINSSQNSFLTPLSHSRKRSFFTKGRKRKKRVKPQNSYLNPSAQASRSISEDTSSNTRDLSFFTPEEEFYNTEDENITNKTTKASFDKNVDSSSQFVAFKSTKEKKKNLQKKEDDWAFLNLPNILKWVFIIFIILVIIIYIGGQMQQIAKSL